MRVADKMNYEQVKTNVAKNRSDMADLQNQAATQKRLTKPSDDPLASARVLATRTDIQAGQQFIKNVNVAKGFLEFSEQSLGELAEALMRAKELAISAANDASGNEQSRLATATEVEQIHSQAIQIGNRKLGDRFLFGGFKTTRAPFDQEGNYKGDTGEMKISIDKEASVAMNVPGNHVFHGENSKKRASAPVQEDQPALELNINGKTEIRVPQIRGPASETDIVSQLTGKPKEQPKAEATNLSSSWGGTGVNVFQTLKDLEIAMRTNDKGSIQDSLDTLDSALSQVVLFRSQLGSRVTTLNATMESLQKGQVDGKTMASQLEDVDTFALVSDINKTESTLKATLETSGRLIQPSLLDFLR